MNTEHEVRRVAQAAMVDLKWAVRGVLSASPDTGLTTLQVDEALGLNGGYRELDGELAALVLALMDEEGTVRQAPEGGRWVLVRGRTLPLRP